jgi:nucleoside phosphorylase
MSRSIRVAPEYIAQVKLAIKRTGFPSQQALATESGFGRSTVNNFVNGKPVDFVTFVEICEKLRLDWQTIVDIKQTDKEVSMSENNLKQKYSNLPFAVIFTAIAEETTAVLYHLGGVEQTQDENHYFCKTFCSSNGQNWLVAVKEIGQYNMNSLPRTLEALNLWKPKVILFVGIAGSLREAGLGDVVAATLVSCYEHGKVGGNGYLNRQQETFRGSEDLIELARNLAQRNSWQNRIEGGCPETMPKLFVEPIVSGEKLMANIESEFYRNLTDNFSGCLAVEMEGYGFHCGVAEYQKRSGQKVDALVIRSISDLIHNQTDERNPQRKVTAARHASAFAFEILANFKVEVSPSSGQSGQQPNADIDALVQDVREKIKPTIIERCGTAKAVGMNEPIQLADIYTNVYFINKIIGKRWIEFYEIQQGFQPESRDLSWRGEGNAPEERVPGIEAVKSYPKLMVWGKAGAGKTTFLKHLAIQSIEEKFLEDRVPIFLSIEQFARIGQPDLLSFIIQILTDRQVTETQVIELLNLGKFLILLDGFDEVKEEDTDRVLAQIRDFLDRFNLNQFVLACRLAGLKHGFPRFTEVEVADFDDDQITQFANKWFPARKKNTETAAKFLKKLDADKPIKELATNPLLLTMLCLVFEENAELPKKRFDLYKEAIDIMLIKWDVFRDIERHQIYKKLQLRGKRDLLSCIAYKTFEKGAYFFAKDELEQYITDFIQTLPDAKTELEALQLDSEKSEKVLESIEAQHGLLVRRARGIYSFSHITIQEYFTAREIINSSDPEAAIEAWKKLVQHITESHWREVFLLVVGALKRADYILKLMKGQVDSLVAKDEELQEFLTWVNQQCLLVEVSYKNKKTGVRAFYLDIDIDIDPDRKLGCAIDFNCTFVLAYASFLARPLGSALTSMLDDALDLDLSPVKDYALEPALAIALSRSRAIDTLIEIGTNLEPEMKKTLEKLQAELPDKNGDTESKLNWSKTHGKAWGEQVKELIVKPHKMGHHYSKLNEGQKQLLQQYYDANLLLVECMNIANMSPEVRAEIMDTLLLPLAEIEQRKM